MLDMYNRTPDIAASVYSCLGGNCGVWVYLC